MRDTSPRSWHRWRVTLVGSTVLSRTPCSGAARFQRLHIHGPISAASEEQPGPDGIRHELVARIRREIAAGTYDTEQKWLLAEEELLRRIEQRM